MTSFIKSMYTPVPGNSKQGYTCTGAGCLHTH